MFTGGKRKAITFSYDDGVSQDIRLVSMFNKYGLKATFNLNSGIQSGSNNWVDNGTCIHRMNVKGLKELYKGHEIAVHTLTHPDLVKQDEETILNEIMQDKINLERLFEQKIHGMAYPYGTFNDEVVELVNKCGMGYARTVIETENFLPQENLLEFKSTCHHKNSNLMKLAKQFVESKSEDLQIFYIWGHSYEFDLDNNWDMMEEFCKYISGHEDIFYGTNAEVLLERNE